MSDSQQAAASAPASAAEVKEKGLLDQILDATPQTERTRGQELIRALVGEALQGTVTWDRNVTKTIKAGMKALDEALSKQLAAIMHHKDFQKLEGSWRGSRSARGARPGMTPAVAPVERID